MIALYPVLSSWQTWQLEFGFHQYILVHEKHLVNRERFKFIQLFTLLAPPPPLIHIPNFIQASYNTRLMIITSIG